MKPFFVGHLMIAAIDADCGDLGCTCTSGCSPTSQDGCPRRFAVYGGGTCAPASEWNASMIEFHRAQITALVEGLAQTLQEPPASEVASESAAAASELEILERRLEKALEELRARRQTLLDRRGEE